MKIIMPVTPIVDKSVRGLCVKPYPNDPKGCPNFGKNPKCPPKIQFFDEVYDMDQPFFAIINTFDYKAHVERMKERHPGWSQRQVECVLYWQGSARKQLKQHIVEFLKENRGYHVTACPEGMGMDVTETLNKAGIELEWPPMNVTYQVAIAGMRRNEKEE